MQERGFIEIHKATNLKRQQKQRFLRPRTVISHKDFSCSYPINFQSLWNSLQYFLMYILSKLRFGFKILKTTNGASGVPLPNMTQYFLTDDQGNKLSFWNDIPLGLKDDVINACIEIPKQRCAKFQVHKSTEYHPFMQDTRKNLFTKQQQLRYYAQFPLFNYGFIPQTWQQNIVKDSLGLYGDDDPIDVCDLSSDKKQTGTIYRAKVLGSFCLIDQGEVDWKILIVDAQEAQRNRINNISQFPKEQLRAVMDWFKYIKIFDGKKPNSIAYGEKVFSKDETLAIINETHHEWKELNNSPSTVYNDLRRKYHLGK